MTDLEEAMTQFENAGKQKKTKPMDNIFTILAKSATGNKNNVTLNSLIEKIDDVENKPLFFLYLMKLNAVEWKQIGDTETETEEAFTRRRKKVVTGSANEGALKRLEEHQDIMKEVSKMIQLNNKERGFMTVANLMKSSLKPLLMDSEKLFGRAYVKMGDRSTLEWVHNRWIPKIIPLTKFIHLAEARYMRVIRLITAGKAGEIDVPPETNITEIDPLKHKPRLWAAWVDPRKALMCRGADGAALNLKEKKQVLSWIAGIELIAFKVAKTQAVKFSLYRYDDKGTATPYWKSLTTCYKAFNSKIIALKGPNEGKSTFISYDEFRNDTIDCAIPKWALDLEKSEGFTTKSGNSSNTIDGTDDENAEESGNEDDEEEEEGGEDSSAFQDVDTGVGGNVYATKSDAEDAVFPTTSTTQGTTTTTTTSTTSTLNDQKTTTTSGGKAAKKKAKKAKTGSGKTPTA